MGAALRQAQQRALSGRGAAELREAADRRRVLVDELTADAARRLTDAGHTPDQHLDGVRATLLAASSDPEAAERVASGHLAKELPAASGFGDLSGLMVVDEPEPAAAAEPAAPDEEPRSRERAAAEALIRAVREELEEAEQELAEAEAAAAEKARELEESLAEAERLERQLTSARKHAEAARRDVDRTSDSTTRVRRRVQRLRDQLEMARAQLG